MSDGTGHDRSSARADVPQAEPLRVSPAVLRATGCCVSLRCRMRDSGTDSRSRTGSCSITLLVSSLGQASQLWSRGSLARVRRWAHLTRKAARVAVREDVSPCSDWPEFSLCADMA